jgi:hypothetical protein
MMPSCYIIKTLTVTMAVGLALAAAAMHEISLTIQ